jgi:hypothetical protein
MSVNSRQVANYGLSSRFSPDVVWDLTEEAIEELGSENVSTVKERADLTLKLSILEKGLRDLDAFTGRAGTTAQLARGA